jgi:hypothetical protein
MITVLPFLEDCVRGGRVVILLLVLGFFFFVAVAGMEESSLYMIGLSH